MLIVLAIAIGLVAALVVRHASRGGGWARDLALVAGIALGLRLGAVAVIYLIARQTHGEGVWLSDEASFFLATESLLPNPMASRLPIGLDHLGGDGYLGLTTLIAVLFGAADSNAFRTVNATLGAVVVIVSTLVARRVLGPRAGLTAGLILAVWPTLILWSATMLRDTLGSVAVVASWWALIYARELRPLRTLAVIALSVMLLLSLRPYLGFSVLVGSLAWMAYLMWRRLPGPAAHALGGLLALAGIAFVVLFSQSKRLDYAVHELVYRQTVTRMETLGRLYSDPPPPGIDSPLTAGAAVAIVDPTSGWLQTGLIQDFMQNGQVRVALTDASVREVPMSQVIPIQSAPIPPLQLAAWLGPNLLSFLVGTSTTNDASSPLWILASIVWDCLLALAVFTCIRRRISPRVWLLPLSLVCGTVLALVAVPGAPGNSDRHRATQTVPLLVVLSAGLVASEGRSLGGALTNRTSRRPASEATPAISRMRLAR